MQPTLNLGPVTPGSATHALVIRTRVNRGIERLDRALAGIDWATEVDYDRLAFVFPSDGDDLLAQLSVRHPHLTGMALSMAPVDLVACGLGVGPGETDDYGDRLADAWRARLSRRLPSAKTSLPGPPPA